MVFYKFEQGEQYKSLNRRGKKDKMPIALPTIPLGKKIKPATIKDVKNLLKKHFGEEWDSRQELLFYKQIFQNNQSLTDVDQEENHAVGEPCDCLDEDHAIHI